MNSFDLWRSSQTDESGSNIQSEIKYLRIIVSRQVLGGRGTGANSECLQSTIDSL